MTAKLLISLQGCLQAKDHLNYRYFHKRALFLCVVAGQLHKKRTSLGLASVKFATFGGNPLLSILVLTLEGQLWVVLVVVWRL